MCKEFALRLEYALQHYDVPERYQGRNLFLSELLDVSLRTIEKWNKTGWEISGKLRCKIADLLGLNDKWLFSGVGQKTPIVREYADYYAFPVFENLEDAQSTEELIRVEERFNISKKTLRHVGVNFDFVNKEVYALKIPDKSLEPFVGEGSAALLVKRKKLKHGYFYLLNINNKLTFRRFFNFPFGTILENVGDSGGFEDFDKKKHDVIATLIFADSKVSFSPF